ncbi:type VI secretion system-associated protein TagO [Profundibacter sp.]
MKNVSLAAGLMWLLAGPVVAQECITIDNDLDRLACYDKASGRTPITETVTPNDGKWNVRIERSEFKDTKDVYLSLDSNEPVQCRFGSAETVTLLLRCSENTTSIFFSTPCHVTSGYGGYGNVEYRVDDKPAGKRGFQESTDNRALGLWRGGSSIPFIKKLFGGKELLIRFTPYGESPKTASFAIVGIDDAIKPLREACHW